MSPALSPVVRELGTLRQAGLTRLDALCRVLALSPVQHQEAAALFEEVSLSWGDWAVGDSPSWPSDITDDGSPFEFSVAFERNRHELRMLFESQEQEPTSRSTWDAGVAFGERLRRQGRADLSLFDLLSDLFAPTTSKQERFSLWHAAVLRDHQCLYKVYFNPELEHASRAPARIDVALQRMGLSDARRFVKTCTSELPFNTRVPYFSIDLEPMDSARAKIYLTAGSAAHATAIVAESGGLDPAKCSGWLTSLIGDSEPLRTRPILICAAFRPDSSSPDVTVHVPIRSFTDNDAEAAERLRGVVSATDVGRLLQAMQAVSRHTPVSTKGVLTYASLRQAAGALRVTGYLAPLLYTPPNAVSGTHAAEQKSE